MDSTAGAGSFRLQVQWTTLRKQVQECLCLELYDSALLLANYLLALTQSCDSSDRAACLALSGDAMMAKKQYRRALWHYEQALTLMRLRTPVNAATMSGDAVIGTSFASYSSAEAQITAKMAKAHMELHEWNAAAAVLETVPQQHRTPAMLALLACANRKQKRCNRAVHNYKCLLECCPFAVEAAVGMVELGAGEQLRDAMPCLSQSLHPDGVENQASLNCVPNFASPTSTPQHSTLRMPCHSGSEPAVLGTPSSALQKGGVNAGVCTPPHKRSHSPDDDYNSCSTPPSSPPRQFFARAPGLPFQSPANTPLPPPPRKPPSPFVRTKSMSNAAIEQLRSPQLSAITRSRTALAASPHPSLLGSIPPRSRRPRQSSQQCLNTSPATDAAQERDDVCTSVRKQLCFANEGRRTPKRACTQASKHDSPRSTPPRAAVLCSTQERCTQTVRAACVDAAVQARDDGAAETAAVRSGDCASSCENDGGRGGELQWTALLIDSLRLCKQASFRDASACLQRLAVLFPDCLHVLLCGAAAQAGMGDKAAAVSTFQRARAVDPCSMASMDSFAMLLRDTGAKQELSRLSHDLMNVDCLCAEAWVAAACYWDLKGDAGMVQESIVKGLQCDDSNTALLLLKGRLLMAAGNFEESLPLFRAVIDIQPDLAAYQGAVLAALHCNRPMEALVYAQAASSAMPDCDVAHSMLGHVYVKQGDLKRARKCYNAALRHDMQCTDAVMALADVLCLQNDHAAAKQLLQNSLSLQSLDFLHAKLGDVYSAMSDTVLAIEQYHTALGLNPKCREARVGLERLERSIKAEQEGGHGVAERSPQESGDGALNNIDDNAFDDNGDVDDDDDGMHVQDESFVHHAGSLQPYSNEDDDMEPDT